DAGVWQPDAPGDYTIVAIGDWSWRASRPDGTDDIWYTERDGDTVTLHGRDGTDKTVTVTRPDADHVVVTGDLTLSLHRSELPLTTLVDRGFHWINEYPNNR